LDKFPSKNKSKFIRLLCTIIWDFLGNWKPQKVRIPIWGHVYKLKNLTKLGFVRKLRPKLIHQINSRSSSSRWSRKAEAS
jgi:hypothetical protein